MNEDDIIRMAREAGLLTIGTADGSEAVYTWPKGITEELECFAAKVAAAEREACAKVCDGIMQFYKTNTTMNTDQNLIGYITAELCGVRIRGKQ